ncbi:hypothetical protein [Paucisalibacillus globulus]|uniref:hypothetical protein n=1 Tax=Paucisalibacillus globulus TaxID=351095 RepID=UPI000BB8AEF0|nr:hypothetical protein [Paucisalibacillus globulus]
MNKRKVIALINLVISGFAALMITLFFAEGAIGENYTDKTFVAPEFFIILVVWGISAIIASIQFFKDTLPFLFLSIFITWASIPVGIMISFSF